MHECLSDIFKSVADKQAEINNFLDELALEEEGTNLIDKANPFGLYNAFVSMFRPTEITYNCNDLNNKIREYRMQANQVIEEI